MTTLQLLKSEKNFREKIGETMWWADLIAQAWNSTSVITIIHTYIELFALYSILPAGKVLPGVAALTEAAWISSFYSTTTLTDHFWYLDVFYCVFEIKLDESLWFELTYDIR